MPWIIAGGALLGGALGSSSGSKAADAQSKASKKALSEQRRQFDLARADLAPYRTVGTNALNRLSDMYGIDRMSGLTAPTAPTAPRYTGGGRLSFDDPMNPGHVNNGMVTGLAPNGTNAPSIQNGGWQGNTGSIARNGIDHWNQQRYDAYSSATQKYNTDLAKYNQDLASYNTRQRGIDLFQADPGYQFRMNQGVTALDRSASARGIMSSGAAGKAMLRFGQDYGSNEYGNYVNRLSALAGIGQSATNSSANLGANFANSASNLYMQQGNARANAYDSSYGSINNALQGGISNYLFQDYLNRRPGAAPNTSGLGSGYEYLNGAQF